MFYCHLKQQLGGLGMVQCIHGATGVPVQMMAQPDAGRQCERARRMTKERNLLRTFANKQAHHPRGRTCRE